MNFKRTDIYKRFKTISQLHTGSKQHLTAQCFVVAREFYPNFDNLLKGDLQQGVVVSPGFFYSQYWLKRGLKQSDIRSDFPMILLTPGERRLNGAQRKRSTFTFDLYVFDLMFYDRNNKSGNKTSTRELEQIWTDCEQIATEVLEAYQNHDVNTLYNLALAPCYVPGLPEKPSDFSPAELTSAQTFLKTELLHKENFTLRITENFFPFDYKTTKRCAGVSVSFETDLFTGCPNPSFTENFCS